MPVTGGTAGLAGWPGARGGGFTIRLLLSVTLAVVKTVVPGALGFLLISGNLGIVCELAVFLPANSFLKYTRVKSFVCIWLGPSCRMREVPLFLSPSHC